ncbi:MAG: 4-alpha-glucanotransferase [Clostridia bacterium]|nr:4-alpha-glucanotransferase [Clostridia bacterium]
MKRASGILLSVTSLPSKYGIGCLSKSAYEFADWLKSAGQSYWQILPLGVTGYGNSPYQSFSTFAGNPYMISLEALIDDGLLTSDECDKVDFGSNSECVDYGALYKNRYPLLKLAYSRSDIGNNSEYLAFVNKNNFWLSDYALFMAIKDTMNGAPYFKWENKLRKRDDFELAEFSKSHQDDIEFHKFLQFEFYKQWSALKQYVNSLGIKIIGDMPIYVAHDSADVWANPELFYLDEQEMPLAVAGCPPDGFSATGQLWGNPLYDWKYHESTNYVWWQKRLQAALNLYDIVRIDHFRGFDEYYAIPYGGKTAINGRWEKGPGAKLFKSARITDTEKIIAEDLGYMTDSVKEMLAECGFAGMKIIEFGFDSRDSGENDHLPHNFVKNSVVYTGTHDNQTLVSWFQSISDNERETAEKYLAAKLDTNKKINDAFISLAMRSVADTSIIPMQDWLVLDDRARMNIPSTLDGNWQWRLKEIPRKELANKVLKLTRIFGR